LDANSYISLIKNRGFSFFLITQFLGALNDNLYRLIVSLILVETTVYGGSISVTAVIFLLPGILFAGYAGHLADRYSKRNVLIIAKSFEILSMLLAFIALGTEYRSLMFIVLFTMATQSTFFGPSKYAIVPEIVRREDLSRANGLLEMSTFVAIIVGSAIAGVLLHFYHTEMYVISSVLVAIAVIGFACSFGIKKVSAKAVHNKMSLNPYSEIIKGLQQLKGRLFLSMVIFGICYFWMLAIVFQLNLLVFAYQKLGLQYVGVSVMQMVLASGIGLGALLAGYLSFDRIEYGLIPLGLLGTGLGVTVLALLPPSIGWAYGLIVWSSIFTGLYIVPLKALLQYLPRRTQKGRMIATNYVLSNLAMLLGAGSLWAMQVLLQLSPQTIFLIWGVLTLLVTVAAIYLLPAFFIRFMLWLMMRSFYRVKVYNPRNMPKEGPALLVCNHVSFLDALLLAAVLPRFIRYLIHEKYYNIKALNWLFRMANAIPVSGGSNKEAVENSLKRAAQELKNGHVVCIFAEGRITRTGNLLPFKRGFERIMKDVDAPIIPVYLDRLWDSIFSFSGGRFFWKLPRRIPIEIGVSFGEKMPPDTKAWDVRQRVQELGTQIQLDIKHKHNVLAHRYLQATRFRHWQFCVADSDHHPMSYGHFTAHALLLSKYLRENHKQEKYIGVLLPASVSAAMINVAIAMAGKVAVLLPYHDVDLIKDCIECTSLKTIYSDHGFLQERGIKTDFSWSAIRDIPYLTSKKHYYRARMAAVLLPIKWTLKHYGVYHMDEHSPATVLWSVRDNHPHKPVVLSHHGVIAPVNSFSQVFDNVSSRDRVMGVLPFFTSMGLLATVWLPLLEGMAVIYQSDTNPAPEDTGRLIKQYQATILFDVEHHYRQYFEKVRPDDFSYIRYAIAGNDISDESFTRAFHDHFGINIQTGFGCAEVGPISINSPDVRLPGQLQKGTKPGSAGQPLPYVTVAIIDVNSGEELPQGQSGQLWVKSPFRMIGYWQDKAATQAVFKHDWFNTESIAMLDEEGFLYFR
jgi:acyl-[acyl-carrier-protein]-phospholipid O-acyltransferase/long-chain-fatty-acid--[acyl-carrier-protein] ligase